MDLLLPDAGDMWTLAAPRLEGTAFVAVGSGIVLATQHIAYPFFTPGTVPSYPFPAIRSYAPGVDVTTAAIVAVRYSGQYRYTLGGSTVTRAIKIAQSYCDQGLRTMVAAPLDLTYLADSCSSLSITCADLLPPG